MAHAQTPHDFAVEFLSRARGGATQPFVQLGPSMPAAPQRRDLDAAPLAVAANPSSDAIRQDRLEPGAGRQRGESRGGRMWLVPVVSALASVAVVALATGGDDAPVVAVRPPAVRVVAAPPAPIEPARSARDAKKVVPRAVKRPRRPQRLPGVAGSPVVRPARARVSPSPAEAPAAVVPPRPAASRTPDPTTEFLP
jgi:hypothetical protein